MSQERSAEIRLGALGSGVANSREFRKAARVISTLANAEQD
jgi:hypothetical protein